MPKPIVYRFFQLRICLSVFIIVYLFSSCATTYTPSYFTDVPQTADKIITTVRPPVDNRIKQGDILSLSVVPLDQLGNLYQAPVSGNVSYSTSSLQMAPPTGNGFKVSKTGTIEVPLIGEVLVAGKTIEEAKDVMREKYAIFYKNFSLNLNFLNHKITVLGEVRNPGSYPIQTDQISIYDALGMAGDITVFGMKNNVILLRDSTDDKKHLVRLDLNSEKMLQSPYYYLKENDMIYVEPNRSKLVSTDAYRTRNIALFATTLSFVLVVLFRTKVL